MFSLIYLPKNILCDIDPDGTQYGLYCEQEALHRAAELNAMHGMKWAAVPVPFTA